MPASGLLGSSVRVEIFVKYYFFPLLGFRPLEVVLAHSVTQLVVILGQTTLLLIFALAAFQIPLEGNLGLLQRN